MDGLCKIYLPYYLISAGVCKHADLYFGWCRKTIEKRSVLAKRDMGKERRWEIGVGKREMGKSNVGA